MAGAPIPSLDLASSSSATGGEASGKGTFGDQVFGNKSSMDTGFILLLIGGLAAVWLISKR